MEKLHIIVPLPVKECRGKYYQTRPWLNNALAKHFETELYAKIEHEKTLNSDVYLPLDKKIRVHDVFKQTSLKHLFNNYKHYRAYFRNLPVKDHYFFSYPLGFRSILLGKMLKGRNKTVRVCNDPIAQFTVFGGVLQRTLRRLLKPFAALVYNAISKSLFRESLVFYTADISVNRKNHLHQNSLVSCSEFNTKPKLIPRKSRNRIVFVGTESVRKGLRTLLLALQRMRHKPQLDIIGLDELRQQRDLAEGLSITYHGLINERTKFYATLARSDILVMPSFGEKQGKVQLEAMSTGLVPVCSDGGGTYTTVHNYYNGLLFREGDVQELARKLTQLLEHRELYNRLQRNALDYIAEHSVAKQATFMAETMQLFWKYR